MQIHLPRLTRPGVRDPDATTVASRARQLAAVAVVVLAAIVFLVDAAPRISGAFGNNHDGRNGAVWALGAEAIHSEGLVGSRVGAVVDDGDPYAHHPPAIYLVAAGSLAVSDGEVALRAPAVLAALVSIPLLWCLLRSLRLSMTASTWGVAAMVGSQMFLVYGSMLNFEALSLPFVIASLLLFVRASRGDARPGVATALGLASALVSWQAALVCVAAAALGEWRHRRSDLGDVRTTRALGAGAIAGSIVTAAWLWWANGGLTEMWRVLVQRSGDDTTLGDFWQSQLTYAQWGFPTWMLVAAVAGIVVTYRSRDIVRRDALLLACGIPVVYAVAFRNGAHLHSFWNFAAVVALATGTALAVDAVITRPRTSVLRPVLAAAAPIVLLLSPSIEPDVDRRWSEDGMDAGELASAMGPDERGILVWPAIGEPASWLDYYAGAPHRTLTDDELQAAAAEDPQQPVLVWRRALQAHPANHSFDELRDAASDHRGDYLVLPLAALIEAIGPQTSAARGN